jgi:hypothetical protein
VDPCRKKINFLKTATLLQQTLPPLQQTKFLVARLSPFTAFTEEPKDSLLIFSCNARMVLRKLIGDMGLYLHGVRRRITSSLYVEDICG